MTHDRIQFIGHSSLWITVDDQHFLINPVFTDKICFIKREGALGLDVENLPDLAALIFTSTDRWHMDINAFKYFPLNTEVITPTGRSRRIRRYYPNPIKELKTDESYTRAGVTITALPDATHPLSHFGLCKKQGYLIKGSKNCFYIAPSTAYHSYFKELGDAHSIDVACLPLNSCGPKWLSRLCHMDIAETVTACQDLKAKTFIPTGWGSFRPPFGAIKTPIDKLNTEISQQDNPPKVKVLNPGEILEL